MSHPGKIFIPGSFQSLAIFQALSNITEFNKSTWLIAHKLVEHKGNVNADRLVFNYIVFALFQSIH